MRQQDFPYIADPIIRGRRSYSGIFSAIIITALVSGGLVYAYEKQIQDNLNADLQRQIMDLQHQVDAAAVVATATSTPTPTPTPIATPSPSPTSVSTADWKTYHSASMAFSMKYPSAYSAVSNLTNISITVNGNRLQLQQVVLSQSGSSQVPSILVESTTSKSILDYYSQNHPLVPIVLDGVTYQKFSLDGTGTPTGYILQHNTKYYVFSFTFPPDESVMLALLQSVRFD